MRTTLVMEDFSALGQISMVASLSILQTFGITTAAMPTGLLSTQTEVFGEPAVLVTDSWLYATMTHWQAQSISVSAALIGYLGNADLVDTAKQALERFQPAMTIVDPAMADQGSLYPGLTENYVDAIRQLCRQATIITPNLTELGLLSEVNQGDDDWIMQAVAAIRAKGIQAQMVISGVQKGDEIGSIVVTNDEQRFITNPFYPGHFYGTGDTFTPLILGFLQKGDSLIAAVNKATKLMEVAVAQTSQRPAEDRKYGLALDEMLYQLGRELHRDD